jgi:Ca2+/H+ antiporter
MLKVVPLKQKWGVVLIQTIVELPVTLMRILCGLKIIILAFNIIMNVNYMSRIVVENYGQ